MPRSKEGGPPVAIGWKLGRVLVAAPVALSVVPLVGTGLFSGTLYSMKAQDLGYSPEDVIPMQVDPTSASLLGEIRSLPGVRAATFSENGLISGTESARRIRIEGYTPASDRGSVVRFDQAGPGYFSNGGIPLLLGRDLADADNANAARVAVINENMARFYFGGRNPIGQLVRPAEPDGYALTIAGVCGNARDHNMRDEIHRRMYVPFPQPIDGLTGASYEVRTAAAPATMAAQLGAAVREVALWCRRAWGSMACWPNGHWRLSARHRPDDRARDLHAGGRGHRRGSSRRAGPEPVHRDPALRPPAERPVDNLPGAARLAFGPDCGAALRAERSAADWSLACNVCTGDREISVNTGDHMKKFPSCLAGSMAIFTLLAPSAAAQIAKVVNAASFTSDNTFAPGTIITIRGNNLANTTAAAPDPFKLPTTLGGVTVSIGGVPSVLFYVSPTQVNTQIPAAVTLGVKTLSLTSPAGTFTAQIQIAQGGSPGIFSLGGTGTRDGAILNAVTFARGPFSVATLGQPTYLAIYATGLDLSSMPKVTINGVSLPVLFTGPAPGFTGLQQINVKLLDQLAGAGRVDMMITTGGGRTTNVVEIEILPSPGQVPFAPSRENQSRNRELAALAWVPGTSLALLTDENDDVVRVIDIKAKKVIRTITLPEGAEPIAVAVDAAGKIALVAERGRDRAAVLDLTKFAVSGEIPLGLTGKAASGPAAVSIVANNVGLVANSDTDNVSVLNLSTLSVIGLVDVGRAPRGIGSEIGAGGKLLAYVANQNDGTISVIDVAGLTVLNTWKLGVNVRPQAILVLPGLGVGVVTEPSSRDTGRVMLVHLNTGAILDDVDVNPDRSGGSSEIAFFNNTVYFANQSGGSVTAAKLTLSPLKLISETTIKAGIGVRALAIDQLDKLLLVTNQGSGEVVLIDLITGKIVGRINGVRGEMEDDDDDHDNHGDRDRADNAPAITSLTPNKGKAGTSFPMTIAGKNFTGATEVIFLDPDDERGRGNDNSSGHGHGPSARKDHAFTVTGLTVVSASQITIGVAIANNAGKGTRVVRVLTPNGESSLVLSQTNKFTVE